MTGFAKFREMGKQENKSIEGEAEVKDKIAEATTLSQVWVPFALFLGVSLASLSVFIKEVTVKWKIVMLVILKD